MIADHEELLSKIRRARTDLAIVSPFYGSIALEMPYALKEDLPIPTAATDGETIFYHPGYVRELTDKGLTFITGHETIHAAHRHLDRVGNRDIGRFNVAADIVTNQTLVDNAIGVMPPGLIYDPNLYYAGGGMVNKIYDLIKPDDKRNAVDEIMPSPPGSNPAGQAMKARARMQKAYETAKAAGNMTGVTSDILEMFKTPKVSWQDELQEAQQVPTAGTERTYSRRNRRYPSIDTVLPGKYNDTVGPIVFAIDCSGSTSDAMVQQSGAEVQSAREEMRPEQTYVMYFDSEVKKVDVFGPDDPMQVEVHGRGGTAFSPIFKYIEDNGIEPEYVIVATDGHCSDYGPEPSYPVIWVLMDGYGAPTPPFGRVIDTGSVSSEEDYW